MKADAIGTRVPIVNPNRRTLLTLVCIAYKQCGIVVLENRALLELEVNLNFCFFDLMFFGLRRTFLPEVLKDWTPSFSQYSED